jgi:CRISPR-associated endonuclease/helicase Cas3
MTTPSLPEELNHIWAKSASRGFDDKPEPLAQHILFAIERFADIIRLRPNLPERIDAPRLWNNLFWACFLHDFGKAAKGFQDMLHEGKRYTHRHEVLSLAFLDWLGAPLSEDDKLWIAAAIVSHHKDADKIQRLYSTIGDPDNKIISERLAEIDDSTLGHLWDWLAKYPKLWIDDLQLDDKGIILPSLEPKEEAINSIKNKGAANIRRWLNAYGRWIRKINKSDEKALILGTISLRGFIISSDHLASAHAGELPPSKLSGPEKLLECWHFPPNEPYYHQSACVKTQGSAILMAPTGSGKTEASLLWAVAQAEDDCPVPRLYYMLPFQASMNAMFDRLNNEKDGAFPGQVGLEHSRSTLAYYRMLEDEDLYERAKQAKTFSNLARQNYYPVRVLSPYQILKAPYCLKGYESILADCFNAAFILDEVHAYEASRLALILGTVKYLREQYGAKFFIMSATLPSLLKNKLSDAIGNYTMIEAKPDLYAKFQRHELHLKDGEIFSKLALDEIAEKALNRKSILVCCNTVKRAQQAFKEMQDRLGSKVEVVLLHGKFNGKDRLDKEDTIRKATGSKSTQRRAIVLVATQVVEVSLDIDLDMIYTDPAPLEALLQRFGRVNRRRKIKPYAPVFVFREPVDGQRIYKEEIVQKALEVLEKNDGKMVDEASTSKWLDEVYCGEIAKEWSDEYKSAYDEFWDVISNLRAFNSEEGLEDMFYQAFDSVEVMPLVLLDEYTRMAEDNPLEASQLFVPIRWGQYNQLNNKGMVSIQGPHKIKVVNAYYDSTSGLDLKRTHDSIDAK